MGHSLELIRGKNKGGMLMKLNWFESGGKLILLITSSQVEISSR